MAVEDVDKKDNLLENRALIQQIWTDLEPLLREHGFDLVEVEFGAIGHQRVLRLYIERPGGTTIDDCTAATRAINPMLEEARWFEDNYLLEVSSPGIARPLRKPEHFEQYAGQPVKVQTYAPVSGRKRFSGTLDGISDGVVTVTCDGEQYAIQARDIKKAHLDC